MLVMILPSLTLVGIYLGIGLATSSIPQSQRLNISSMAGFMLLLGLGYFQLFVPYAPLPLRKMIFYFPFNYESVSPSTYIITLFNQTVTSPVPEIVITFILPGTVILLGILTWASAAFFISHHNKSDNRLEINNKPL